MSETQPSDGRIWNVILAITLGAAVVGIYLGTQPAGPALLPTRSKPQAAAADVIPGQSYVELRERRFGPGARLTSDLGLLRAGLPDVMDEVTFTAADREAAVALRTQRRAFDGAPPTVPHAIDETSAASCLACHEQGLRVGDLVAPVMSHAPHSQCTQCHASIAERWPAVALPGTTSFVGLESSGAGQRVWEGAPPSVPHRIWMREDCHSCHGVTGLPGLRTTHPERQNCLQCHASVIELAQ